MTFAIFTSCKKDDAKKAPVVTDPTSQSVLIKANVELSFAFTAEAGYKTSVVEVSNGAAEITTDATTSATNGTVTVTYTAGTTSGAASVKLTVTDNDGQTSSATAVINVSSVPTVSVTENIAVNTTWSAANIYILEGRIAVLDGVTLTIEAGTIIKGREGSDVNATALIIARGAKLMANGTATAPIIFTSVTDEIIPGEIASPNLLPTDNGLWGGLIILGKSRSSFKADAAEAHIEGIPETDDNGLYGGADDADNSGSITYVSIRHGGAALSEGNEINGLSLGSVGSGTKIENIEIIGNSDDGVEWFGGSVNVKNVVVWNCGDDAIDTDMSYRGTIDNIVIINPENSCFELDGPEGSTRIGGLNHTIQNATVKVGNAKVDLCDNDDNTNVNMNSIYYYDVKNVRLFRTMPTYGDNVFSNFEIAPATLDVATYFIDGFAAFATAVNAPVNAGATLSAFDEWSWARVAGEF